MKLVYLPTPLALDYFLDLHGINRRSAEVEAFTDMSGDFWTTPPQQAYRLIDPTIGVRIAEGGVIVVEKAPALLRISTVLETFGITSDMIRSIIVDGDGTHLKNQAGELIACLSFARQLPSPKYTRSHFIVCMMVRQLTHLEVNPDVFVGVAEMRISRPNGVWVTDVTLAEPARPTLTLVK